MDAYTIKYRTSDGERHEQDFGNRFYDAERAATQIAANENTVVFIVNESTSRMERMIGFSR